VRARAVIGVCMLSVFAMSLPGCFSAIKRGLKEIKGAESEIHVISDIPAYELLQYGRVAVGDVRSEIGTLVPDHFIALLRDGLTAAVKDLPGMKPDGGVLRLDAKITFFQAGGAAEALLGKEKMCIMRVTLRDPDGAVKGEFLVVGQSEAVTAGQKDLAKEMAKRVRKYLLRKLPTESADRLSLLKVIS